MPAAPAESQKIALEIDVATSLALSRATTRAVSQISKQAKDAMVRALETEAQMQHDHGGPVGELIAALIAAHAQELK